MVSNLGSLRTVNIQLSSLRGGSLRFHSFIPHICQEGQVCARHIQIPGETAKHRTDRTLALGAHDLQRETDDW